MNWTTHHVRTFGSVELGMQNLTVVQNRNGWNAERVLSNKILHQDCENKLFLLLLVLELFNPENKPAGDSLLTFHHSL